MKDNIITVIIIIMFFILFYFLYDLFLEDVLTKVFGELFYKYYELSNKLFN